MFKFKKKRLFIMFLIYITIYIYFIQIEINLLLNHQTFFKQLFFQSSYYIIIYTQILSYIITCKRYYNYFYNNKNF